MGINLNYTIKKTGVKNFARFYIPVEELRIISPEHSYIIPDIYKIQNDEAYLFGDVHLLRIDYTRSISNNEVITKVSNVGSQISTNIMWWIDRYIMISSAQNDVLAWIKLIEIRDIMTPIMKELKEDFQERIKMMVDREEFK